MQPLGFYGIELREGREKEIADLSIERLRLLAYDLTSSITGYHKHFFAVGFDDDFDNEIDKFSDIQKIDLLRWVLCLLEEKLLRGAK